MRILLTLLLFFLFACGVTENNKDIEDKPDSLSMKAENIQESSSIDSGDSLIVQGICAVLFIPDSAKIKELKKGASDEDFSTVADDNMWYIAKAREFLKKQDINVFDTQKKVIVFVKSSGERTIFDISSPKFDWGLLLFNGTDKPMDASLTEVEEDYQKYFAKK